MLDPCLSKQCDMGSSCRVFQDTDEAYCEPSCDLDNGGCGRYRKCELINVTCPQAPCPPLVNCLGNSSSFNYAEFRIGMLRQQTILVSYVSDVLLGTVCIHVLAQMCYIWPPASITNQNFYKGNRSAITKNLHNESTDQSSTLSTCVYI